MSFQYFLNARGGERGLLDAFRRGGCFQLDGLKAALATKRGSKKTIADFQALDLPHIVKLAESLDAHFPAGLGHIFDPQTTYTAVQESGVFCCPSTRS